ncbi:MAG: hypothetical protein U9Q81_10925 [Pseudomonadota bacterium]|nr:hypothetical protein [Pseudomonadota bacterium]
MRGRWTVNLLLLILVAALGAAVQRELQGDRHLSTLTDLEPEAIAQIAIERAGAPVIRLTKAAAGWRMEEPYRVAANGGPIEKLVRICATAVHRSFPESAGAQRLGLDPARLRLTLDGLTLRFGGTDPVSQRRYVGIGDQVHLIGDGFHHYLLAAAEDYVDRRLLPHGFRPGTATLDGEPLSAEALAGIEGLTAERVEPLGEELAGRLFSLDAVDGDRSLRFLVSPDGRRWTRLDLRLSYLLGNPPVWALGDDEPAAIKGRGPAPDQAW